MITKSELQKVNEQLQAEDRRELGEPPATEKLLAYSRGELPPAEEERMREMLVAYPDLARGIAEPFPREGAAAGDADYLSDAEFATHWLALEKRLNDADGGGRVLRFYRRLSYGLAAMLVLAFGSLLWQQQAIRRTSGALVLPQAGWEQQVLMPDGTRGAGDGAALLKPGADGTILVLPLLAEGSFTSYRGEILDAGSKPPRAVWNQAVRPREDNTVGILVPRGFLAAGHRYQVVLYGADTAGHEERLAAYGVRVP